MVFQAPSKPMTVDAFIAFALLPENAGRSFEFVDGEILEKMPGSTENSALAFNIGFETELHCRQNSLPCFISTGDGAYRISDNVLAPDFAYKPTPMTSEFPDPVPPLWISTVITSHDTMVVIRKKRQRYLEAGILLWEVYPDERQIDVYAPQQPPLTYGVPDTIDVIVVTGLKIDVAKIFR